MPKVLTGEVAEYVAAEKLALVFGAHQIIPDLEVIGITEIFWRVNGILVIDRSTLDQAELYGECLTHAAGHYVRWQEWQALRTPRLVALGYPECISWTEYDQWPWPDCLPDSDEALRALRGPTPA